jgi:hypothetical protein
MIHDNALMIRYKKQNQFHIKKMYEGHLESKERFAIKKYLLIIGKKKNMQVLSYTFTYVGVSKSS